MRCQMLLLLACLGSCQPKQDAPRIYQTIEGETMGTYYRITFGSSSANVPVKADFEAELRKLNLAVSTYVEQSIVSQFNRDPAGISEQDIADEVLREYFFDNVAIGYDLHARTDGYYDPTVMPLVNFWGFGYEPREERTRVQSGQIDSIMESVGLHKVTWDKKHPMRLQKYVPSTALDFSASAKGYAIDQIAHLLEQTYQISDYLVDVGGEARAAGVNGEGNIWRVGVNNPEAHAGISSYAFILELDHKSVATSGNYRNFYEVDGEIISHTMNPHTGFYEKNNLLSVSVIADECAYADGFATACMARGFQDAREMITLEPGLEALFIYLDETGLVLHYMTEGLRDAITSN